ncbi:MAG TPA: indole-3-glycerol-phosphate synthase [Methanoregulaceae archaeon]|nr:indole-3-glycerol-phosphate synthase [Methanoregulaceae archaeon]
MFLDDVIRAARARSATLSDHPGPGAAPPVRSLGDAIRAAPTPPAVIAEIKPASPTHGRIRDVPDHGALARELAAAGACALSVLTEPAFFGGAPDRIREVRAEVGVPILRKDFIVDERQLAETRTLGGDAVLLIARVLGERLGEFVERSLDLGLEPVVEVRTVRESDQALTTDASLIGVNNRDLETLKVDLSTTARLGPRLRAEGRTVISMSGVSSRADLVRLAPHCDAVLIGTTLMRAESPARTLRELCSA